MRALTELEIRSSVVNAPLSELTRMWVPDLTDVPWHELEYFGWVDRSGPSRAWMVVDYDDGPVGLLLRMPTDPRAPRRTMCNLCHTIHGRGGVRLATAPRIGEAGLRHNMVGTYLCADLSCSLYARGLKELEGYAQLPTSLQVGGRVIGLRQRLNAFVARVLAPQPPVVADES